MRLIFFFLFLLGSSVFAFEPFYYETPVGQNVTVEQISRELSAHFRVSVVVMPSKASAVISININTDKLETALDSVARLSNTTWVFRDGMYYIGVSEEKTLEYIPYYGYQSVNIASIIDGTSLPIAEGALVRAQDNELDYIKEAFASVSKRNYFVARLFVLTYDDSDLQGLGVSHDLAIKGNIGVDFVGSDPYTGFRNLGISYTGDLDAFIQKVRAEVEVDTYIHLIGGESFTLQVVDTFQREISQQVGSEEGAPVFTTSFDERSVGFKLSLLPSYLGDGSWMIRYNVSDSDGDRDTDRRVESVGTCLLGAESSSVPVVALRRLTMREVTESTPILGSIPVLGWFFRKKTDVKVNRNVMVVLQIVQTVQPPARAYVPRQKMPARP